MLLSTNSIRVYITLNAALMTMSYFYYLVLQTNLLYLILFTSAKNYYMTKAIEYVTNEKPLVNKNHVETEGYFVYFLIQSSAIEAATVYIIVPQNLNPKYWQVAMTFIPMSFLHMVIFDLMFYGTHRFLHQTHLPWHKQHHEYTHLNPILTFYQDVFDIIATISIPFIISTSVIQTLYPLSLFEIALLCIYKSYIEICGHSGHVSYPASSFPQFFWLPKLLNIDLYSEDHALHHTEPGYNFSKQFSLWDKVFGTFKSAPNNKIAQIYTNQS